MRYAVEYELSFGIRGQENIEADSEPEAVSKLRAEEPDASIIRVRALGAAG